MHLCATTVLVRFPHQSAMGFHIFRTHPGTQVKKDFSYKVVK